MIKTKFNPENWIDDEAEFSYGQNTLTFNGEEFALIRELAYLNPNRKADGIFERVSVYHTEAMSVDGSAPIATASKITFFDNIARMAKYSDSGYTATDDASCGNGITRTDKSPEIALAKILANVV